MIEFAKIKAKQLKTTITTQPQLTNLEKQYGKIIPSIDADVKGKEFRFMRSEKFRDYVKDHPKFLEDLQIDRRLASAILNFVNGKRSITTIRNFTVAETGQEIKLENVVEYLNVVKSLGVVDY